jgi:hypothetical protein
MLKKDRAKEEEAASIVPKRTLVFDSVEHMQVVRDELVLMDRGAIPLMRVLGQAYDGVNVNALELELGAVHFLNLRKFDKGLEARLQAAWRRTILQADMEVELPKLHVRIHTICS